MPKLIRYLLWNFTNGFAMGALVALALLLLRMDEAAISPLALWLQIFSLAAPFGLGFLGTALMLDTEE
jgi:hypothetical protein